MIRPPSRFLPKLHGLKWLRGPFLVRTGYISPADPVLLCDLEENQLLERYADSAGLRLLAMSTTGYTQNTPRIMGNVLEAILAKNNRLARLEPRDVKQLFQTHLSMERCFFEEAGKSTYHGFLLNHGKVYSLCANTAEPCFVYRQGSLLEFHLSAQQFIQLEPGDLFIAADPDDMKLLLKSRTLRQFYLVFKRTQLGCPFDRKGFQKMRQLLKSPLVGIYWDNAKAPNANLMWQSLQNVSFNRNQWLIVLFLFMWTFALLVSQWLST